MYPASSWWVVQWYESVHWVNQCHSSVHCTSQCTLAQGKGLLNSEEVRHTCLWKRSPDVIYFCAHTHLHKHKGQLKWSFMASIHGWLPPSGFGDCRSTLLTVSWEMGASWPATYPGTLDAYGGCTTRDLSPVRGNNIKCCVEGVLPLHTLPYHHIPWGNDLIELHKEYQADPNTSRRNLITPITDTIFHTVASFWAYAIFYFDSSPKFSSAYSSLEHTQRACSTAPPIVAY